MPPKSFEILSGARAIAPLVVAVIPIGLIFGAVAATKGLSPIEALLMSALVFAGGSQFVAMDIWTHPANVAGIGIAALLVNIRHTLMGVSLGTKLQAFSPLQKAVSMLFMADEIWAVAEFRAKKGQLTPYWYLGVVAPFYLAWVLSGFAGASLGALLGDPVIYGLDFVFPAVFVVLVMGFWKGRETGAILAASAAAAIVAHYYMPGVWYILAGALGGLSAATVSVLWRPEIVQ